MITDLRPYPAYKDSGIPWVGRVPHHWEVKKLKSIATLHGRIGFHGLSSNDYESSGIIAVSGTDFRDWGVDWPRCHRVSEDWYDKDKNIQLSNGDLLVTKDGTIGKTAIVRDLNERAILNSGIILVRPKQSTYENRFVLYVINSQVFSGFIDIRRTGATIDHLYEATFKNFSMPLPRVDEQAAIVRFLDQADRRVRRYVGAKRRLIALLNEQKQAVIRRAITSGLDPTVRLKHSGVEWLGDVPEHWSIRKLGSVARVFNGTTPSRSQSKYWSGGTIPWISSGKVNDGVVENPSELITDAAVRETSLAIVPRGSVILGLVGQGKTRGMCALLSIDAYINQNLAAIVPGKSIEGPFLRYMLTAFYKPIREIGRGGNQEALNCELVSSLRLPLPPLDEQQMIVDHLHRELAGIARGQERTQRDIELFNEYRLRLVADIVTGQLDVREAAARLPEEAQEPEPLAEIEEVSEDLEPAGLEAEAEPAAA